MPEEACPLRVLLLSPIGAQVNPYISLLRDGLAAAGAAVRLADRLEPADLAGDRRPDVIHLHWLDRYDRPPALLFPGLRGAGNLPRRALRRSLETVCNLPAVYQWRRWQRLHRLMSQLRNFQAGGGRVAYTVHNLDPHEGESPADRWGTIRLLRLADTVHVHDASTAEAVAARFGRCAGVVIVPHGHYLDSYPNTAGRAEARARLGLPAGAFVYATLGLLRPYKGLEELLPAFRALPDADAILLLAGKPGPGSFAKTLATLAAADPRIRLVPDFVPAADVQLYLNAADVCVLPYRQITTSGAALLAFSFGLPVIAPAIGAFPSLIAGRRGLLYDPADSDGLPRALAHARQIDWRGVRPEIVAWVAQFDWGDIGRRLVTAYRGKSVTSNE
jgi:glycosyltransferase involved in cell wall biosynthesis